MERVFNHIRVEADKALLEPGYIYHGALLLASSGGAAAATVYDGVSSAGEVIDHLSAAVSDDDVHIIETGIVLQRGLYVDLGSNVDQFIIYYETPRHDPQPLDRPWATGANP